MQIISGQASGIQLKTPRTLNVRPTSVRARKALFDSIGMFVGESVVDLCAGSGALGLEAASRGAKELLLVERSAEHCRYIQINIDNVVKAGVSTSISLKKKNVMSVASYTAASYKPTLIFADPPYDISYKMLNKLLNDRVFANWGERSLVVWEMPALKIDEVINDFKFWECERERQFAGVLFLFFRRKQ
jgi:16S rRNA (guanine966-N2)-methyltransferase